MPGRSWFVAAGDKQEGPYSEEEFRDLIARGHDRPDTYVWADGMQDWKYAGDIPGLLSPGGAPPAIPRPACAGIRPSDPQPCRPGPLRRPVSRVSIAPALRVPCRNTGSPTDA